MVDSELAETALATAKRSHGGWWRANCPYCVAPETRLLTVDLRWVRVCQLSVGDQLIGFDEKLGYSCKLRRSTVTAVQRVLKRSLRFTMSNGAVITSSFDHQWVFGRGKETLQWEFAGRLRVGDRIQYYVDPWEADQTREGGYLAGILDGEGSCSKVGQLMWAQLPGSVLDRSIAAARSLGVEVYESTQDKQSGVHRIRVRSDQAMHVLGSLRPERLLAKAEYLWEGRRPWGRHTPRPTILAIEDVGVQEVVAIQTTTRTFIAEGFLSHNCLLETGKPDKRQSLGIKPAISFFMCFKCGVRGRLKDVPDEVLVMEARAAKAQGDPQPIKVPPDGYEPIWYDEAWTSIFLEEPRKYLLKRGVSREVCEEAMVGVVTEGKLAQRIVVPVLDVDSRTWLGYSARDWTNRQDPRYRYPKGMARGVLLYNWSAVYVRTDEPLIFVEGVFDALPYWPHCAAALGKPGDYHRRLLLDARRPIAVCLDGDAWEEGWALAQYLQLHDKSAGAVRLPPATDPNNVDHAWLREEAKKCTR